ncbi:MAG: MBL fold metallo-hydrolase [Ruthenibacterium sp.]
MAEFTTLYSGSSGNCAYIAEDGRYLLVDMGKNCKTTVAALKTLDAPLTQLGGILVTHEHSDHVSGLAVFLKQHPVPVYGSAATLEVLAQRNQVPSNAQLVEIDGRTEDICGFGVQSFTTSHDSVACVGYRITTPRGRVASIATDLGYVSDEVLANLLLADCVSLEANYDLEMLMCGGYPYYLKTRIASKRGHLCNDESAETLVRLLENGCKKFALCHISLENNTKDMVYTAVKTALLQHGVIPEADCVVQAAMRHSVSPILEF